MKKIAIAFAALLLLIGFASWNVWHAVYEPVITQPSLVDLGRQQLHAQLEQSKTRESEIEQQDWASIPLLRGLIEAHQHRIDQLKDNSQAGEILAHDRDAIARIEKRIADLQTQQAQQAAQQAMQQSPISPGDTPPLSTTQPSEPPAIKPHPQSAAQTAKPAQKTQPPASPKPAPPQTP
jgi:hypothetical protein